MSFFDYLRGIKPEPSAKLAKERLQIILAHERNEGEPANTDFLPALQKELLSVISKYVKVNTQDVKVSLDRQGNYEVLEVNIFLPETKNPSR